MLSPRLLLSLALAGLTVATGDWPCTGDADCPAYAGSASNNTISANSKCVADPAEPKYGYCGFVGATCSDLYDCDFGLCVNGMCSGYFGAKCAQPTDCLGHVPCGTDGTCGGAGGDCSSVLGGAVCSSGQCGADKKCVAVPASGMPSGSACQTNSICSNGDCSSSFTCAANAAAPAGASQAARHRHRRDQRSHGHGGSSFAKRRCPSHQTACMMGISSGSSDFECIDTTTALESCGGCIPVPGSNATGFADPAAPAGVDCTALPNVEEVSCQNSRCKILACRPGSSLNPDGTSCLLTV